MLNAFSPDVWVSDIHDMHSYYGFHQAVKDFGPDKLKAMLEFRINFLQEELNEMKDAASAEDVVDALIDLCVVAIGTLDIFNINSDNAWSEVHEANMSKKVGVKPERPNPLGLPDLIKPEGWIAPSHENNHGTLAHIAYPLFNQKPCEI